jgi:isopenicillin N synthase-like dioxygenase
MNSCGIHATPLLKYIAQFLGCEESAIQEKLNHPMIFDRVNRYLGGKKVRTTYLDRKGEHHEFNFVRLSFKTNLEQYAYEGYLGVNLVQHFYCKYR